MDSTFLEHVAALRAVVGKRQAKEARRRVIWPPMNLRMTEGRIWLGFGIKAVASRLPRPRAAARRTWRTDAETSSEPVLNLSGRRQVGAPKQMRKLLPTAGVTGFRTARTGHRVWHSAGVSRSLKWQHRNFATT